MDDTNTGVTASDVVDKIKYPIFAYPKDFSNLPIKMQAEIIAINDGFKINHMLDFCNYTIKQWHSTSILVQNQLNKDCHLESNQTKTSHHVRPEFTDLKQEITKIWIEENIYRNSEPDMFPEIRNYQFNLLGMTLHRV